MTTKWHVRNACLLLGLLAFLLQPALPLRAQQAEPPPPGFEGAVVTDKPNAQVPLDLPFLDESGHTVHLRDFFKPGRPVLLSLVYYNCPMLCNLTLNGITEGLRPLKLTPGKDFEVVTVSFNPDEKPDLARRKKDNYLQSLGRPEAAPAWHFLTGREADSRALADAVGFGYKRNPADDQYLHQSAIYILTPDGRVSRMIAGISFEPELLHDSFVYASQGQLGSPLFRGALSCGLYHYDAASGRYVRNAQLIMQLSGLLTVLILGSILGTLWYRDVKRHRAAPLQPPPTG